MSTEFVYFFAARRSLRHILCIIAWPPSGAGTSHKHVYTQIANEGTEANIACNVVLQKTMFLDHSI
jgi:hypothetical protein